MTEHDHNMKALEDLWLKAKEDEVEAGTRRVSIENEIISLVEGGKRFQNLNITYGETRKWDQDKIAMLEGTWLHLHANMPFPFKREYKEVRAITKILEESGIFWKQYMSPLLTVSPRKPSFTYKEQKA